VLLGMKTSELIVTQDCGNQLVAGLMVCGESGSPVSHSDDKVAEMTVEDDESLQARGCQTAQSGGCQTQERVGCCGPTGAQAGSAPSRNPELSIERPHSFRFQSHLGFQPACWATLSNQLPSLRISGARP
jgi:hypothetical protein